MSASIVREQRRHRRYEIRLPLELLRAGSNRTPRTGETRNMSSGGVLFTSPLPIDIGEPIEFMVTLHANSSVNVRLHCRGKVVRLVEQEPGARRHGGNPVAVAATLERYEFLRVSQRQL